MSQSLSPELLAALCHDLRGPLGALGTWVHVLNSSAADEATRARALASLGSDVRNLARLIEEMSELSTLLSGSEPEASLATIDLGPFLKDLLAAAAQEGGDVVDLRLEAGAVVVLADPIRLRQTLWPLVAIATRPPAQGQRSLEAHASAAHVEIVVETRPPRAVPLALARARIEAQGGTLDVESRGAKSVVVIRLQRPSPGQTT